MKSELIKSLLKIANDLDSEGLHEQASEIDAVASHLMRTAEEMDPEASAAELGASIMSERESRPTVLGDDLPLPKPAIPAAVTQLQDKLKKQFKHVVVGEGKSPADAMKDAESKFKTQVPGKRPAKVDTVAESGKTFKILSV